MPAKNLYHDLVIGLLKANGWNVTHDPLVISYEGRDLFVDLGAEQSMFGAEKQGRRIAVEVQSFLNPSPIRDLQEAVGQFEVYRAVLAERGESRIVFGGSATGLRRLIERTLGQLDRSAGGAQNGGIRGTRF
jgi:hypothetical protein